MPRPFLTGQYAHNHGVLSNKAPYGGYYALDSSNTLPVWLKRAGYETILVGKYLNGYGDQDKREIPPGWTEWHGAVNNSAYQFYGYTLNENGKLVRYGRDPASYQSDVYADKAVEVVRRRAAERPFFLWVSFLAPHIGGPPTPGRSALTTLPAPRHLGRFAASPLPTPPSFNEEDVSDKPGSIRNRAPLSEQQVTRSPSATSCGSSRSWRWTTVGRIVAALKKEGELSRTVIVFTSDNGFMQESTGSRSASRGCTSPRRGCRSSCAAPAAGLRLRQPVANIDLAPTIVAAARTLQACRWTDARCGRCLPTRASSGDATSSTRGRWARLPRRSTRLSGPRAGSTCAT